MDMFKQLDKLNEKLGNISNKDNNITSISDTVSGKFENIIRVISGTLDEDVMTDSEKKTLIKQDLTPDNLLVFMGATGGVGTTTILTNVATKLRSMGNSVLVIDLDILNPSIKYSLHCNMEKTPDKDLVSYLTGGCVLGEAIYTTDNKIAVMSAYNRTIVDYIYLDNGHVASKLSKSLSALKKLFDFVLIDIPSKLIMSDIIGQVLYDCDHMYMVWNEDVKCVSGTELLRINMSRIGIPYDNKLDSVIFNARTSIDYRTSILKQSLLNIITVLPYDSGIKESNLRGEVFIKKGMSASKHSGDYCNGIDTICKVIMEDSSREIAQNVKEVD